MLQRWSYARLREQHPNADDAFLLALLVWGRLMPARMQGMDVVGLARTVSSSNEPSAADLRVIMDHLQRRGRLTLQAIADAIVGEEEHMPSNIPPAPHAQEAARQVTEVLRSEH